MSIMLIRIKRKGFSILEYTILVVVVLAALIAMRFYVQRAIMGKYRQATDTFGFGRQFEPGRTQIE